MNAILRSLQSRLAWYQNALAMFTGAKPYKNGFNWPFAPGIGVPPTGNQAMKDQYIMYLSGCIHELHNAIDMIEAQTKRKTEKEEG